MFPQPPPVCHFVDRSAFKPMEPEVQGTCVGGQTQPGLMPPGVSKSVHDLRVRSIFVRYLHNAHRKKGSKKPGLDADCG